jgi:hypothetical protein
MRSVRIQKAQNDGENGGSRAVCSLKYSIDFYKLELPAHFWRTVRPGSPAAERQGNFGPAWPQPVAWADAYVSHFRALHNSIYEARAGGPQAQGSLLSFRYW